MAKPRPAQITYELLEPDFVDRWLLVDQQRILRRLLKRCYAKPAKEVHRKIDAAFAAA